MGESFFDALVTLVHKEVMAAKNSGDDERLAGVVTDLATTLGKAIAMTCDGNAKGIDMLLTGVDHLIAETATDIGGFMAAVSATVKKARPS